MSTTTGLFTRWDPSLGIPTVIVLSLAVVIYFISSNFVPSRKGGIRNLGGLPIIAAWPFFTKRHDFLVSNFLSTGESMFRFNVMHHTVVAVRGAEARKMFFDDKSFDLNEGYKILRGAAPRLSDISVLSAEHEEVSAFNKTLLSLFHRDRLGDVISTLFDDMNSRMMGWGKEGRIDPFKNVYDLVFQMTVRMATCRELASDTEAVTRLQSLYWILMESATPATLLLPWFPSRANKAKEEATKSLFVMLHGYVQKRKEAKVPNADAIDVLLSAGVGVNEIIGFVLGVVFAGVLNTGVNACWVLLFLASNPKWKTQVIAEVKTLVAQHTNTTSFEPLHKRLSAIPMSAWEDEMPVLDSVIRETIRIVVNGALLRRNVAGDMPVGNDGKMLPKGSFVVYQLSDTHLNPDIYTNPQEFDPDRFSAGREEDKKAPLDYLGWGAGRHPCTGVKVAKLELKMIIALFAIGYEFDIVNESGASPSSTLIPDYNNIHHRKPLGDPCYLHFKRVVD